SEALGQVRWPLREVRAVEREELAALRPGKDAQDHRARPPVEKVQVDQRGSELPIAEGCGHLAPERARQLGNILGIGGKKTREVKREVVSDGRAHLALRAHV